MKTPADTGLSGILLTVIRPVSIDTSTSTKEGDLDR